MRKDLHFCVDIDNVLGDTDEVMRRVIAEFTDGRVQLSYQHVKEFNYADCVDDNGCRISKEEWNAIHDLFSEPRFLWQIQPTAGAVKGLHELSRYGAVHIATTRLPKARRTTVEWLENHGFPPHDLHFLKHGQKHSSLRVFTAAVEDDYDQAASFASIADTRSFLIRHPWNAEKPAINRVRWVKDWDELVPEVSRMTDARG